MGSAICAVGEQLSLKYNVAEDNRQQVMCITNKLTGGQTWFNEVRSKKPQTFKAVSTGASATSEQQMLPSNNPTPEASATSSSLDTTNGGQNCDFCKWREMTAQDTFGRLEREHAVTGSNLFKYAEPCHGLVLFKHHDPLHFTEEQLKDFLIVSEEWYMKSHILHPDAAHAFLIWNCMARAGASQYHGHGQLMLTRTPLPVQAGWEATSVAYTKEAASVASYTKEHLLAVENCRNRNTATAAPSLEPSRSAQAVAAGVAAGSHDLLEASMAQDLLAAHRAVGLLRCVEVQEEVCHNGMDDSRAWIAASICPLKDMEVMIAGTHLSSPAFIKALHCALRALIDRLGSQSFNVGIFNIDPTGATAAAASSSNDSGNNSSNGEGAIFTPRQEGDEGHITCPDGGGDEGHITCPDGGGDVGHITCPDGGGDEGHTCHPDGGLLKQAEGRIRHCCHNNWDHALFISHPATSSMTFHTTCCKGSSSSKAADQAVTSGDSFRSSGAYDQQDHNSVVEAHYYAARKSLVSHKPIIARIVSRGRVGQVASDFGCLEVVGGASIGHTDPFRVMAAIDQELTSVN
ncbi:hypothetical protein CEUSTIGMA_g1846.t1 [Chlamydomonas eustigma]|uniref:Uncharacterized protein n=1 Tax=Chlamydomonas eustigma TaxID=1157962 RepID=A0A250WUA4_9CHLO|nr:hypothetical protein CEUSTIGMA_g1846.t1 [Chlamydomonas eustigma]|eukprot:GAX74398.1 hypothetical protein CEUSTIGMA_g1846.t1 [Chlamydomonas eustigma]